MPSARPAAGGAQQRSSGRLCCGSCCSPPLAASALRHRVAIWYVTSRIYSTIRGLLLNQTTRMQSTQNEPWSLLLRLPVCRPSARAAGGPGSKPWCKSPAADGACWPPLGAVHTAVGAAGAARLFTSSCRGGSWGFGGFHHRPALGVGVGERAANNMGNQTNQGHNDFRTAHA